jgi:hypothetical protein
MRFWLIMMNGAASQHGGELPDRRGYVHNFDLAQLVDLMMPCATPLRSRRARSDRCRCNAGVSLRGVDLANTSRADCGVC